MLYRSFTLALLVALTSVGCGRKEPSSHKAVEAAPTPLAVSYTEVASRSEPQSLALSGTLRSRRDSTLSSKLSGRITYLKVEEGDPVRADEVLVQIDVRELAAQTQQAEAGTAVALASQSQAQISVGGAQAGLSQSRAQLEVAQRQLKEMEARRELARKEQDRQTFLAEQGAVPRQRADQAQTDFKVASAQVQQSRASVEAARSVVRRSQVGVREAQAGTWRSAAQLQQAHSGVAAAEVNLDYGQLRAPFAGVVIKKMAFEGEVAAPGKPLLQIQDIQNLELSLNVPESQIDKIHLRQRLDVEFPALGKSMSASVRQIVASTDPASRTFEARIALANPQRKLLPGMFGRVKIPQAAKNRLLIPNTSLVQRGGLQGVFVAGPKAEFRMIKTGEAENGRVEVLSGLTSGDKLILSPPSELQEGSPIQTTPVSQP